MHFEPNEVYHIYNRGNNKQQLFFTNENYLYFLKKVRSEWLPYGHILSYCLMPNHFHFLLKVNECEKHLETIKELDLNDKEKLSPVEKSFRDFFISYAKSINKSYSRTGSLFQYKFKRKPITDESYLNNIAAYIHLNPVRAGIVKNAENWNFSSYRSYLNDLDDIIVTNKNEVFSWFRGKDNFIDFHKIYRDFQKDRDYLFE